MQGRKADRGRQRACWQVRVCRKRRPTGLRCPHARTPLPAGQPVLAAWWVMAVSSGKYSAMPQYRAMPRREIQGNAWYLQCLQSQTPTLATLAQLRLGEVAQLRFADFDD